LRCVWINILFRFGMAYQIPRARLLVNINLIKKNLFLLHGCLVDKFSLLPISYYYEG